MRWPEYWSFRFSTSPSDSLLLTGHHRKKHKGQSRGAGLTCSSPFLVSVGRNERQNEQVQDGLDEITPMGSGAEGLPSVVEPDTGDDQEYEPWIDWFLFERYPNG